MSLFNTILSALDNPNQQANSNQLTGILNTVQQLSGNYKTNPTAMESAMAIVGKYTRSSLQDKRKTMGDSKTQALVSQFSGTRPNNMAVNALFSLPQTRQMVTEISTRTGIPANTIQAMLPILVPLVLNVLQSGASNQNSQGSNTVLGDFLNESPDKDADIGSVMQIASRFLNR